MSSLWRRAEVRYEEARSIQLLFAGKLTAWRELQPEEPQPRPYVPGHTYSVLQKRMVKGENGKKRATWVARARVRVTEVYSQDLHDATMEDVEREGHRSRRDLFVALGYYEHVRGPVPTWVVRFERDDEDEPLFLHKHTGGGYTNRLSEAMLREPEAIDRDTLAVYSHEAHERDAERETRRRQEWEDQALWIRVEALEKVEAQYGLGREMSRVRAAVAAAESKHAKRAS